jgi:hypothetical protein
VEVATCKPSIYKKHDVGKIVLQVITSLREKIDEFFIVYKKTPLIFRSSHSTSIVFSSTLEIN